MNVLPILEMSVLNELFIFFYENILDENIFIFLACWTFAKSVGGKGFKMCVRIKRLNVFLCLRLRNLCMVRRKTYAELNAKREMRGIFMYSITYCKQK